MKATMPELEIVTRKGKPVSVIIPIKDYEESQGNIRAWREPRPTVLEIR
jgi:antitoxin (DNA-binding transcriptional repressor) of toxin-antitoxin stability system